MTPARGVVERRATFGVLEVDRVLGVERKQLPEHELRRRAAVVPTRQVKRRRLVRTRPGVQIYPASQRSH